MKAYKAILLIGCLASSFASASEDPVFSKKKWSVYKVESHVATGKTACFATTNQKDKDVYLDIYFEANEQGGYVEPVVQVVAVGMPSALKINLAVTGKTRKLQQLEAGKEPLASAPRFDMTIALAETKKIEVPDPDATEEGATKEVEQQIFIAKRADSAEIIKALKDRWAVKANYYDDSGKLEEYSLFDLSGSGDSIRHAESKACK